METDARREQEKEIEKQGSNEMLNDFLPISNTFENKNFSLEELIFRRKIIFRLYIEIIIVDLGVFRSRARISMILIS